MLVQVTSQHCHRHSKPMIPSSLKHHNPLLLPLPLLPLTRIGPIHPNLHPILTLPNPTSNLPQIPHNHLNPIRLLNSLITNANNLNTFMLYIIFFIINISS